MNRHVLTLCAIVPLIAFIPAARGGEGFGMMKKTANLTRVHPAEVLITGTRIGVRVSSQSSEHSAAAQRLSSELESQLVGSDPRLTLEPKNPDTVIDVRILQSKYDEHWEERQGTRQVPNGKDAKGRQQWRTEEVTLRYKIVTHVFSASYKVDDVRSRRSLIAGTVPHNYRQEFQGGNGSPDASALESDAVDQVVETLKHQLTPTKEIVGVLLPKGRLDSAAAFADAGLWSKYLDALEKLAPFAAATDEAYRQYALGVAYEAVGYGADDLDTTLKYLEQASVHYNNAVDAHPKEGYFTKAYESIVFRGRAAQAPLARVQSALVQYQKLKEFSNTVAQRSTTATGAKGTDLAGDDPQAMTNASVIEMLRAGLPEDVIVTSIDSTSNNSFDVSPKGLIQLSEAKASKRVMQHIQAIASKKKSAGDSKPKKTVRSRS
jgi:hypothetical protein